MLIRTLAPLLVAGVLKYVTSRILFNHFEQMIVEGARKREQNSHNTETTQSDES